MSEMPDIIKTTQMASSAFSLMKGLENGHEDNNVQIGNFIIEKTEYNEKDGNKMLHIQVDEDTEFWAIETKDSKKILALKTEEDYFYYAVTENNDKQLTLIAQDDIFAQLKTSSPTNNYSISETLVQTFEDGKHMDFHSLLTMKDNGFAMKSKIVTDNETVAQTDYSVSAKGNVKIRGYSATNAFDGQSKILEQGQISEGNFFESQVLSGTTIVDNEIWCCERGKLSLLGIIHDEADKNTADLRLGGKKVFYHPVSEMTEEELSYVTELSKSRKKEILETLGGKSITTTDLLCGNVLVGDEKSTLREGLKAQSLEKTTDLDENPMVKARYTRVKLRCEAKVQNNAPVQNSLQASSQNYEGQVSLPIQKER